MSYLRGLGLSPGDPCYDPDHPWYLPDFFSDGAECECMAAAGLQIYPCGEQCVGYSPDGCSVATVMADEIKPVASSAIQVPLDVGGGVLKGTASGAITSISDVTGIGSAISSLILLGGAFLAAILLMKLRK